VCARPLDNPRAGQRESPKVWLGAGAGTRGSRRAWNGAGLDKAALLVGSNRGSQIRRVPNAALQGNR
jgi:hypothetical protein